MPAHKIDHQKQIPKEETMSKVIKEESFLNCFKTIPFDQRSSALSPLRMGNEEEETNLLDVLDHALGLFDSFPTECITTHEDADENLLTRQTVTNLGKVERSLDVAFESASAAQKLKSAAISSSSAEAGSQEFKASSKKSVRVPFHASQRSSASSSYPEKVVRFHEIHIRDYERVVGDNPSCSAGPPVGIGWSYGETRTINVNNYEEARPYRRSLTDMMLTREEREALLLAWGVSFRDIVDSIRSNIRVKNQRRQTVTNLGKVERLEEAFESAARKLKRAVLPRRRSGNKVKKMKQQSVLAQQTLATLRIAKERALHEIHHRNRWRLQHKPEEDFYGNSPVESKVRGVPIVASIDDDGASSMLDGLTIGNSTTASVSEMEKFYRELELEMFGEDPPPSMVGRTLEVPGIEIPEEDRVYNDLESVIPEPPSVYGPEDTDDDDELDEAPAAEGFPIEPCSYARSYPGQIFPVHHRHMSNGYSVHAEPNESHCGQHDQGSSMLSRCLEYDTNYPALRRQDNHSVESYAYCHSQFHSQNGYRPPQEVPMPMNRPPQEVLMPMNSHLTNGRLSSSLDNVDVVRSHNVIMFHVQPHIHRPVPPPATTTSQHSYTFGANDLPQTTERRRVPERYQVRPPRDEPKVRHCPPPTYFSPTHWMEERDSPRLRHMHEPVTITEEESY